MPGIAPVSEGGVLLPGAAPLFGVESSIGSQPYGAPMVFDPTQDDAYDALVIRDMQTGYGAYFKMNEPAGATSLVSRGPLFPANTLGGNSPQAAGGVGPIPSAELLGLPNRAWRVRNTLAPAASTWLARLNDFNLFNFESRQSYSLEFWVFLEGYHNRGSGNGPFPIMRRPSLGFAAAINPGSRQVYMYRNSSFAAAISDSALQKWAHWVFTYDGGAGVLRTYANGVLIATTTAITDLVATYSYGLILGYQMDGLMARTALYGNIVLNPTQIAEHAAAGAVGWAPGDLTPQAMPIRTIMPMSPFIADGLVADQKRFLSLALGTVLESDIVQSLGSAKTKLVDAALESDAAVTLTRVKRYLVGTATGSNAALAFGRAKTRLVTTVSESDAALALGKAKKKLVGLASEVDLAVAIVRHLGQVVALATALETDVVQALAKRKTRVVSAVTETDAAQALVRGKTRLLAVASEANAALGYGRRKLQSLVTALENNSAISFVTHGGKHFVLDIAVPRVLSLIEAVKRFP